MFFARSTSQDFHHTSLSPFPSLIQADPPFFSKKGRISSYKTRELVAEFEHNQLSTAEPKRSLIGAVSFPRWYIIGRDRRTISPNALLPRPSIVRSSASCSSSIRLMAPTLFAT